MNRKLTPHSCATAALSAGMLLAPGLVQAQGVSKAGAQKPAGPADRTASQGFTIKFASTFLKWRDNLRVAGMLEGRPVFKTDQGEFFQVDPGTGDLKFHSPDSLGFIKLGSRGGTVEAPNGAEPERTSLGHGVPPERTASSPQARVQSHFIKFDGIKGEQRVSVAGVDAQGRVIQTNSRGERFYLSPNGDMVFVK